MTPKERSLSRQLDQLQASLPQAQLEAIQANSAKDQAEATLRQTQADLDLAIDVVVANPPTTPIGGTEDPNYARLRGRFPGRFQLD